MSERIVLTTGATLDGRYEIGGLLAAGGMGEVYRARRILLGDEVVIKVIRTTGGDAGRMRERFMRESRLCAKLRHPNIVTILDFAIAARRPAVPGHGVPERAQSPGPAGVGRADACR